MGSDRQPSRRSPVHLGDYSMHPKIKLIAIAKDEAAYLPEWIFHHLYFGFDEIEVFVNRTCDNTLQLLSAIAEESPRVKFQVIDWIDLTAPNISAHIQHIAYAYGYNQSKLENTHIMFLDIDEFWTPLNFKDTIKDCVSRFEDASTIYFEWCTEGGTAEPFTFLQRAHAYKLSRLGKSLIRTNSKVQRIDIHKPLLGLDESTLLADGSTYRGSESEGLNHQFVAKDKSSIKDYIIVHRMSRSEMEYLSMIYNGIPEEQGSFKLNRATGYEKITEGFTTLAFDALAWTAYELARTKFFHAKRLRQIIPESQRFITDRYEKAINALPDALKAHGEALEKVIQGLSSPVVADIITAYYNHSQPKD